MIKANELRTGNSLTHVDGGIEQVHSVRYINGRSKINGAQADQFNPIPLTEEWLLKCGFTKNDNIGYGESENDLYLKKHRVTIEARLFPDGEYVFALELNIGCGFTDISQNNHPEFVHQLQNLYFALTGEELEVKI